jgi:arylsulfatase A-like enzyme
MPDLPAACAGFPGTIGETAASSRSWWPGNPRPPAGAPNIIIVLLDDMGYSDVHPFGSEIATPTLNRLSARGLRLTNYHTAPLCSMARAALMTGLNPHHAGFGFVANIDPGFPGYTMEIAEDVPTLPEVLRDAGYATFAVCKWHLTLDSRLHDGASRRSWPTQRGFDRYYGVMEGFTNLHQPHRLVMDNSPLEVDSFPDGYYLTDDITDQAIKMLKGLRAHDQAKPFFLYVAHHAVHGPLQAKPGDIAKYRGRYDCGWDEIRQERFRRQLASGLFPAGTAMAPRNHEAGLDVPAWSSLPSEQRDLFARYQEVYAAMVDNVDQNLGLLLDTVAELDGLDNTLVIFTSDNGATAEGGPRGSRSYLKQFEIRAPLPPDWGPDVPRDPGLIGGPRAYVHYPRGWAMASNTPFRLYKAFSHAGGVRVPFIMSWPARCAVPGAVRTEYQYVTDVLPTILELAGVRRPEERHGHRVRYLDGVSFADALADPLVPTRHTEQYSETAGNRSFYAKGWKLVARHLGRRAPVDDREWELYNIEDDPTETVDVAATMPETVVSMAARWKQAAWKNLVFPLDDGSGYLLTARPPCDAAFREPVKLLPRTPTVERYRSARLIAFRSFGISVRVRNADGDAGVLVAHGDQGGGYSLYVEDGSLFFAYNEYGVLKVSDAGSLAAGTHHLFLSAQAGDNLAWSFRLLVDDAEVATLPAAQMLLGMAPFHGIDVGVDRGSPVSWPLYERHGSFRYTGELISVTYLPGERAPYDPETVVGLLRASARAAE